MEVLEHFSFFEPPELEESILIAAFAGWPDAAEVATTAARFLVRYWSAQRFAAIDPEHFYVFTVVRPVVRQVGPFRREVRWPANEFYAAHRALPGQDMVILVGIEPSLRWKAFAEAVLHVVRVCNVRFVLTLGGLLADVPHTGPVRLTGSANSPQLIERLESVGVRRSRYEGPTSIHSVLFEALTRNRIPTASIWGNVPHYLATASNPKVVHGILAAVRTFLGAEMDLWELELAARRFVRQVDEAIAQNPEMAAYVRALEEREGVTPPAETPEAEEAPGELPSKEALLKDLEEFLRSLQQRRREDESAES
jgi:proteasome assembly chaperone (PAC2) family protein